MPANRNRRVSRYRMLAHLACVAIVAGILQTAAMAGEVTIVDATAQRQSGNTWRFSVTLKHADTGWEHYADRWDVVSVDGKVLGTRTLHHPHVEEQPFTRSLGGVKVPAGTTEVLIRARDSKHGFSDKTFKLTLPAPKS